MRNKKREMNMEKKFDLEKWVQNPQCSATSATNANCANERVEELVKAIEEQQVDITGHYDDWVRVGIALAKELGESGRSLFHRISQYYINYNIAETDKKYNQCLRDPNPSVGLGSIFHLAKQAGVLVRTLEGQTPTCSLPSGSMAQVAQVAQRLVEDWSQLPDFLQRVVAVDENEDVKSLLLFGSLVTLSAVMPGVSGIYGGKRVYPNLFGFVVAPPASSKGKLADVVSLVKPIEDEIEMQNALDKARYEEEMAAYKAGHAEGTPQPKQPAAKMLVIAANASSTALYQALNDSGGTGLTFETEGDTVSMTLKTDFGNYSDGLRKAFHHEEIAYIRRKENERTRIRRPRWSVLLAGTPAQVTTFIPNSENGLFSRFLFYSLPRTYEWQDMFAGGDLPLDEHFEALGEEYLALYHRLQQCPVTFVLTPEQQVRFNAHFAEVQREYAELYGDDLIASVRRLGLICYRLAMVLTVVRLLNQDYTLGADPRSEKLHSVSVTLCSSDGDFEMAMTLVDRLLQHTAAVYSNLLTPVEGAAVSEMPGQIRQFLQALPEDFTTEEFVAIGEKMGIPRRTAQRYVGKLTSVYKLLERPAVGRYRKEKRELRNEKQERRSKR